MHRGTSLLDQFADLVVGEDAHRLAERTLEVVMVLVNGRSGGVFAASDERLTLFASRGIDQYVLDAVHTLWGRGKDQLRRGQPLYVPDCGTDRDLAAGTASGPSSLAVFPVFDGDDLVALLYVDSQEPHFCQPHDVERLAKFSRLLARAMRPDAERAARERMGWEAYLERTPVQDIEREKMLLLLNRNEWNIARVARLMGVTRRTVYLRLRRYNIPRERVLKTRIRSAAS
jgi:putative methionine-R-sulfoxide reductase with GAF domain